VYEQDMQTFGLTFRADCFGEEKNQDLKAILDAATIRL
jgi:hypothetical protein